MTLMSGFRTLPSDKPDEASSWTTHCPSQCSFAPSFSTLYSTSSSKMNHLSSPFPLWNGRPVLCFLALPVWGLSGLEECVHLNWTTFNLTWAWRWMWGVTMMWTNNVTPPAPFEPQHQLGKKHRQRLWRTLITLFYAAHLWQRRTLAKDDAQNEMIFFDNQYYLQGTRTAWFFCQVEVVLCG